MYTRTFFKGFLMPSIGVGVVHAKGEQNKDECDDSRKLIRARELPLYVEPPKCVECTNKIEPDESGFLITTIRCVRQEFQQIVGQARMIQVEAQNLVEEVKKETEDVVSYLRQEENLLPRLGAIGLGGFAGYLLACRKGLIKKALYSTTGAGLIAAIAYPNQAREYTEEVMCEVKKYAVIGYHFLNGADVDWKKLESIKPPCISQKDGATTPQDAKSKPVQDSIGKKQPEPEEKGEAVSDKKEKPDPGQTEQKEPEAEKEKPKIDPCIEKIKASERTGPADKRSYTERCRERGICKPPKKNHAMDGDKTAAQCDPECAGPKTGPKIKRNDSAPTSKISPVVQEPENRPPVVQEPEYRPPNERTVVQCPPGCVPADQQQKTIAEPFSSAIPPNKRFPQQSGNVDQSSSGGKSNPYSPDPNLPIGEQVCLRKRRIAWRNQSMYDNAKVSNDNVAPQNSGKAGNVEQSPITGGVSIEKQVLSAGSGQSNVDPGQLSNTQGLANNQELEAKNVSDSRKSTIKSSSVTITYPNPPGHADSRVIMNDNESPIQPKEVTMKSHRRLPEVQRADDPIIEPQQTILFRSRRKERHS